MPIRGKRTAAYSVSGSYSGPSYAKPSGSTGSIDYYGRDECPATPYNRSADLIELHQQSPQQSHMFDGTPDQLDELTSYGIDPNGYGSNINHIQDMWRPHSL